MAHAGPCDLKCGDGSSWEFRDNALPGSTAFVRQFTVYSDDSAWYRREEVMHTGQIGAPLALGDWMVGAITHGGRGDRPSLPIQSLDPCWESGIGIQIWN